MTDQSRVAAPYTTTDTALGRHPARFSGLDVTAGVLAAVMMIGPLFAAFYGRYIG